MDRERLRATQAPLKERYAEEPEAAVVTLKASGSLGEGVSCSVDTGRALAQVTLRAVATSLGIAVESGTVRAEGELDFRGTLAVDRDAPVGFRAIRLSFDLDADADEEQLATLLKLTERYCVVFQTLSAPPELSATFATKS
jgi:uncharacterized OsmC-like protein